MREIYSLSELNYGDAVIILNPVGQATASHVHQDGRRKVYVIDVLEDGAIWARDDLGGFPVDDQLMSVNKILRVSPSAWKDRTKHWAHKFGPLAYI